MLTPRPAPSASHVDLIAIVVAGRFVAFDIARVLARKNRLAALISSYPKAYKERLPAASLIWNPWLALAERVELSVRRRHPGGAQLRAARRFGRWAAGSIPDCGIVQGWTGFSLETFTALRATGTTRVAMRGSAHICAQDELLREEFARFGLTAEPIHAGMIDRELAEYSEADYVNVLSTFARNSFIAEGYPPERLILTPLAAETGASAVAPRVHRKTKGPLRVLFLGSISLQKGVQYLLQAASRLGDMIELSLIGGLSTEGPEILRRYATGRERHGKVDRTELPALFASHDVLVLPSVQDGFGAVITEAMAAGLPVIASTHTGGPDVIDDGETGFLVEPRDVNALVEALSTLAMDPVRCEAMGEAALRSSRAKSSWEQFVDNMLEQYDRAYAANR